MDVVLLLILNNDTKAPTPPPPPVDEDCIAPPPPPTTGDCGNVDEEDAEDAHVDAVDDIPGGNRDRGPTETKPPPPLISSRDFVEDNTDPDT